MKKIIFTAILCIAMLSGCGTSNSSSNSIQDSGSVSSESTEYEKNDVIYASNWISDVYGDGLLNAAFYIRDGKDNTGKDMDIEFCVENLKTLYQEKEKHNDVIHALDDSVAEQKQLITAWDKTLEQADILVEKLSSEIPKACDTNYDFNIDLLQQYYKSFYDSYRKVVHMNSSEDNGMPKFK